MNAEELPVPCSYKKWVQQIQFTKGKMTCGHFIEDFSVLHECAVSKKLNRSFNNKMTDTDQTTVVLLMSKFFKNKTKKSLSFHWFCLNGLLLLYNIFMQYL